MLEYLIRDSKYKISLRKSGIRFPVYIFSLFFFLILSSNWGFETTIVPQIPNTVISQLIFYIQ